MCVCRIYARAGLGQVSGLPDPGLALLGVIFLLGLPLAPQQMAKGVGAGNLI